MKTIIILIGSLIVISSFSIVAKRIGTDDCNLSKRCCKIISKYDALESCEKVIFINDLFLCSRKCFCYKRKVCLGLQDYVLNDIYNLTKHLEASAGHIGSYYESMEQLDNDIKEWKRILGCNQDE